VTELAGHTVYVPARFGRRTFDQPFELVVRHRSESVPRTRVLGSCDNSQTPTAPALQRGSHAQRATSASAGERAAAS
jgi:hypothetical protein